MGLGSFLDRALEASRLPSNPAAQTHEYAAGAVGWRPRRRRTVNLMVNFVSKLVGDASRQTDQLEAQNPWECEVSKNLIQQLRQQMLSLVFLKSPNPWPRDECSYLSLSWCHCSSREPSPLAGVVFTCPLTFFVVRVSSVV